MRLSLRPPMSATLARLAAAERDAALTYDAVGATDGGPMPEGFHHDRWEVDLGYDDGDRFDRCARSVLSWGVQRGAGFRVEPDRPVVDGETYALAIRLPLAYAIATARIVYVLDEPDRRGFAYGTLPAHPECGEEAFIVTRAGGRVGFEVVAFSRPRDSLARLGAPVARLLQRTTNERYLTVLRDVANGPRPGS